MENVSKMLGAATGGVVAATAVVTAIVGIMPANVAAGIPWWGYVGLYVVCVVLPAWVTYQFPPNAK